MGTNLGLRYCLSAYFKQYALFVPVNALGSFLSCRYLSTVWIHKFSLLCTGIFATPTSSSSISEHTQTSICMHAVNTIHIPCICTISTNTGQMPTGQLWPGSRPSPKKHYATGTEIILRTNQTVFFAQIAKNLIWNCEMPPSLRRFFPSKHHFSSFKSF